MINFRKTLAVTLAVATLGTGIAASSTPASAWGYHPWGLGLGLAAATGVAIAATSAAANPYYNGGYGYYGCWRQPVVDAYGNVIGHTRVCR